MEENRRRVLELFEKHDNEIQKRVKEDIAKYRVGHFTVKAVDKNGKPCANTPITITQKNHEFHYGANLFMLDEFETEEKNALYRSYFKQVFNMGIVPFYWRDLEPVEGELRFSKDSKKIYRRPNIDLCLEYCNQNQITPKAHCLVYETWRPDWLPDDDLAVIKQKYEKRMRILAETYGDKISCWEVTNETLVPVKNHSALYSDPNMVEWCFDCANHYFKQNELLINETHHEIWNVFDYNRSQYYMQLERAFSKGAQIDGIGMQYHMFLPREQEYILTREYYDPMHLFRVMDTYADFKRPLQITEITIPAYSDKPEDEELQAELIKRLYTIWFSHPNMEAIIYWNLVDGYAAWAPQGDMTVGENYYYGGLLRFDMTPKPAFYAIKDLFTKTWHTDLSLVTDENGCVNVDAFYGDYDIQTPVGSANTPLRKSTAKELTVTLQ